MNTPSQPEKSKTHRTLWALLAVFALPLTFAWIFTVGPFNWRPTNTSNHGVLLQPPLLLGSYGVMDATGAVLSVNVFPRDWILVVLSDGDCMKQCQSLLQIAERIHVAVGRDMSRVTLVSLSPDDDALFPNGQHWLLPADGKLIEKLRHTVSDPQLDAVLLIVDFQGRIVLIYPPTEDGLGALEDLKRLLHVTDR